ncbi:putative nuclease HARBI1 [Papilio machaon]|uniref:putative nuclease HARBI1 n=1 Tax=Papilio machaon TaxID=76193 RepID=UPI001E66332D|nr:putative nuclease HARBI1 [Papilio machaon]
MQRPPIYQRSALFYVLAARLLENEGIERETRLQVLCALSFYATGSYQRIVGMAKYLDQTTVSKCVKEVTDALITPEILGHFIKFPNTRAERDIIKNKFYAKYGFPGVIGCIDGSHFHIFTPNKEIEHLFYCRKHFHSPLKDLLCHHYLIC